MIHRQGLWFVIRKFFMHFGLALGPHNLPADRNHWDTTRDMARAAEELGFDSVWMNDHVMFRSEE